MKKFAEILCRIFESMTMRIAKRLILAIFMTLLVLDIMFVTSDNYPTIRQMVFDSSPRYFVIIWLFGLAVTNIFFQREPTATFNIRKNFIILFSITLIFWLMGLMIKQPTTINCDNYKTEIPKFETPLFTRILCQDLTLGVSEVHLKKCQSFTCNDKVHFKLDLTVPIKFLLLLSGILLGYFLWPARLLPPPS